MKYQPMLTLLVVGSGLLFCQSVYSCSSPIYCHGKILDLVQRSRIFNDSKAFVDMALKVPPEVIEERFNILMNDTDNKPNKKEIKHFVEQNFDRKAELEPWAPPDYKKHPKLLERIVNPGVKKFATALVGIWAKLAKKVKDEVRKNKDRHSLIPLPNGFMVPGGRFKEIYYWDSYWIVKGLLLSDMTLTVRGILENFMFLIQTYGFVPNGSRIYYLNRSQPPLLSLMVGMYIDVTNDTAWLKTHVDTLAEELNWWLEERTLMVDVDGDTYELAHYAPESGTQRPESYFEDTKTCLSYPSGAEKKECYRNLKSGAESGWDFSSRWIVDEHGGTKSNISHVQPRRIIPVDLNAYLCRGFKEMVRFYKLVNDEDKSIYWQDLAESWERSIQNVLYNQDAGIWYDYDTVLGRSRKYYFASNFAPLWTETYPPDQRNAVGMKAAKYLESQDILRFKGGIPTSLDKTGQQWDLPNAFPPLQEIVILGLRKTKNDKAERIARTFARRWVNAMMRGYEIEETMFEKYSAERPGRHGSGGEYPVQSGFGWTNGVALSLINEYFAVNTIRIGEFGQYT